MNKNQHTRSTGLFFSAVISSLCMFAASLPVHAKKPTDDITLIEMGDLHATLVSHQAVLKAADGREYYSDDAGGMAKLKAKVDEIRADNPNSLLLSVGDLTHGSAEGLFTVGDAVMAVMNQFDIDVFTPGNWDFGYGPAVYRARFTPANPNVPANIAVMAGYIDCDSFDNIPKCEEKSNSGIIKAEFPVSAINLYNVSPPLPGPPTTSVSIRRTSNCSSWMVQPWRSSVSPRLSFPSRRMPSISGCASPRVWRNCRWL